MATFEYTALDVTGRTRKGVLSADTARGARKELKQRRLTPLKLAEVSEKRAAAAESRFSFLRRTSIGGRDLALVTRQLATLIRGGAPVEEAVRAVAAQADKPAVRRTLLSVRNGVMEGRRLSEAMAEDDASFSKLYRAMVAAGEASGGLGPVLERLSDFLEKMQAMQRKIMGAMIYPIVLSFTAIAMVTALMVFVVPKLVEQFASIGQELPPLTRALIATS
ncbi:MAG: type II secretion system F family protein, partial [Pseudomonadota bacterium]